MSTYAERELWLGISASNGKQKPKRMSCCLRSLRCCCRFYCLHRRQRRHRFSSGFCVYFLGALRSFNCCWCFEWIERKRWKQKKRHSVAHWTSERIRFFFLIEFVFQSFATTQRDQFTRKGRRVNNVFSVTLKLSRSVCWFSSSCFFCVFFRSAI